MPSGPPSVTPTMIPSVTLWVNSTLNRLMSSFNAVSSSESISLKQGDSVGIEVHILESDGDGAIIESDMLQTTGLTLAIGRIDAPPLSGDYKLSYNGQVTSTLPFNASASAIQSALNELTNISSMGGISVISKKTIFRINWNQPCLVPFELQVYRNTLYPSSSISLNTAVTGSLSQNQSVLMHIKQVPVANITSFVEQIPSVASIQSLKAASYSGDTKIWRVKMITRPKGGSYVIIFIDGSTTYTTRPISVNASPSEVFTALNEKLSAGWIVTKNATHSWDISSTRYSLVSLAADSSSIISYKSLYGILNLNTLQVEELLSGNPSATAVLEIELNSNGTKKTVYQGNCTILNDLIDSDVYSIVEWGDYIPANSVVRYDTTQGLSTQQKQVARNNIDAVGVVDLESFTNKDIELESRISNVETSSFSAGKIASINLNSTLSALNTVVSFSQMSTALLPYSLIGHTHEISNINGLQSALDGKALSTHTHDFTNINGLSTQLSLKMNVTTALTTFPSLTTFGNNTLALSYGYPDFIEIEFGTGRKFRIPCYILA